MASQSWANGASRNCNSILDVYLVSVVGVITRLMYTVVLSFRATLQSVPACSLQIMFLFRFLVYLVLDYSRFPKQGNHLIVFFTYWHCRQNNWNNHLKSQPSHDGRSEYY